MWPPTGIALAVLILYGYNLWPAVTIGAFAVNMLSGASPLVALFIALGNTSEAMLGTYMLRRTVTLYRCFERVADTLRFIAIVTLIPIISSATIGVLSLTISGKIPFSAIPVTWLAWWIGDILGALVVTPFLIVTLRPTRPWNFAHRKNWEIIGGYASLVFVNWLIFWNEAGTGLVSQSPLLYLILFPFLWAGIRFGTRGMTMFIFLTSVFATFSTVLGHGPFVMTPLRNQYLSLQMFIGTLSITFLIFEAVVKERNQQGERLAEHVDELEVALVKIRDADKAKNDFLAILAHELRNPLAPVLSSLELMKIKSENRLIVTMENHVHTLARLLDDLLDISRISKKKFKLEKKLLISKKYWNNR